MEIIELKAFSGRNIYSHRKVIKMILDLKQWDDVPTLDIENYNSNLLAMIPSLSEHKCSLGYPGGFVERLKRGTYMAHVIEHIAIELLNILGERVCFGRTRRIRNTTSYIIIYEYIDEIRGLEVGKVAVQISKSLCSGKPFDLEGALRILKEKVAQHQLGPSTGAIVEAARKRKIPVIRIGTGSIIQLGYGKHQKRLQATIVENTSCISVDIACDKSITKMLLIDSGIPVPEGKVCRTLQQALTIAGKIGYPVVVKPEKGNQGKGVSLNITNSTDIAEAFNIAKKFDSNVLVEKYVPGKDYRVLVVNGRVVAVARRIPARVIGDGIHTISDLVKISNRDIRRGEAHEKPLTKIIIDEISKRVLHKQGYTVDSIPPTMAAGLSLGEYGALVAAGVLDLEDALPLVRKRGQFMQEAVPFGVGAMAAIIGLSTGKVEECCRLAQNEGMVSPANYNCPGQIVVSGYKPAVEKVCALAKDMGAKRALMLAVSAPFHSPLLEPAGLKLELELKKIRIKSPSIDVISNVHATMESNPSKIKGNLVLQVSSPVKWEESVRYMIDQGIDTYVEVGPGRTLNGFLRKISRDVRGYNIEDMDSLNKTLQGLGV